MTTLHAPDHSHAHGQGEHGHDHPPHLAHHWDNPKQQFDAGKLGMWLFLATEVLLFGGLFCAYAVWRGNHPELFKYGSQFLNTKLGAINTAVLILSSLTMAWGVTAAQQNKQGLLRVMLMLTLCGAVTFLVIKYFEYKHKFEEGYFPGLKFYATPPKTEHSSFWHELNAEAAHGSGHDAAEPPTASDAHASGASTGGGLELKTVSITPVAATQSAAVPPPVDAPTIKPAAVGPEGLAPHATLVEEAFKLEARHHESQVHPLLDAHRPSNAHMFFNIYFMMTGLHGIHVVIGMIVIIWLLIRSFMGHFSAEYFTPVDLGGLYWHIVDLIWIFLFPLFYLI